MKRLLRWRRKPQIVPEQQLDYSGMNREGFASAPEQIQSMPLLLRSCKEVMMNVFIDCAVHEIYTGLGTGTPEEIAAAWQEIVSEWGSLNNSADGDYVLDLSSRILELRKHIDFVKYAVFYLERRFNQEIINRLVNECGYAGFYPEDDRDAYLAQLEMVTSLCKRKEDDLDELLEEEVRMNKNQTGKPYDEHDFEKEIGLLSRFQHYRINKMKTSAFEYAHIRNNFIEEFKNSQKNNKQPDI